MKILYVISRPVELNTSASIRNRATVLGLLENGHEVTVLTTEADPNHSAYDAEMSLRDVTKTIYVKLSGIQSVARFGRRFKFFKKLRSIGYKLMVKHEIYDNFKSMVNHTGVISLKEEKFDIIISSSDPKSSHLFVSTLLQQQGADFDGKWIQIWGDPFAGDITLKADKKLALIRKEEQRLLREADKVVYVSELTRKAQQEAYPESAHKMFNYPIPYMNERITRNRSLKDAKQIELIYCGDYMSHVRNLRPLYEAVKRMPDAHLTVCGLSDTPLESCENVEVHSRVPYEQVCEYENNADVLVHLSNLKGSQIPGKIYQYSGTNKPVLFILDGDEAALLSYFSQYGRYSFANNTTQSIIDALNKLKAEERQWMPLTVFGKKEIAERIISGG